MSFRVALSSLSGFPIAAGFPPHRLREKESHAFSPVEQLNDTQKQLCKVDSIPGPLRPESGPELISCRPLSSFRRNHVLIALATTGENHFLQMTEFSELQEKNPIQSE